jgi:hypothetical protein
MNEDSELLQLGMRWRTRASDSPIGHLILDCLLVLANQAAVVPSRRP